MIGDKWYTEARDGCAVRGAVVVGERSLRIEAEG